MATIFLIGTLGNLGIALRWYFRRQHGSMVPLLGGLAGLGACFTLPFASLRPWWWLPLLVDLGTGYLLAATALFLIRRLAKLARGSSLD